MSNDVRQVPVGPYGIVHTAVATGTIDHLAITDQLTVRQTINALQDNPRPDGHEPNDAIQKGLTSITIKDPPYIIMYSVDDEKQRVVVISVTPQRW